MKQVAHLLVYMHKHGIVHRDMKPENFLLTDESDGAQVKLADFGLAGLLDPSKHNLLFDACGTPGYVAPEVLEGKPYNEGVDMWALGVITYILLCGFPPFYNDNNAQLYAAIKQCKYQFIRPYWDNVSDDAKDLIKNLMCRQKQRLSAADVLRHKWIVGDGPHLLQELPSVRLEMKKFNAKRKLRAVSLCACACWLSECLGFDVVLLFGFACAVLCCAVLCCAVLCWFLLLLKLLLRCSTRLLSVSASL